jgi:hypothetical protein
VATLSKIVVTPLPHLFLSLWTICKSHQPNLKVEPSCPPPPSPPCCSPHTSLKPPGPNFHHPYSGTCTAPLDPSSSLLTPFRLSLQQPEKPVRPGLSCQQSPALVSVTTSSSWEKDLHPSPLHNRTCPVIFRNLPCCSACTQCPSLFLKPTKPGHSYDLLYPLSPDFLLLYSLLLCTETYKPTHWMLRREVFGAMWALWPLSQLLHKQHVNKGVCCVSIKLY